MDGVGSTAGVGASLVNLGFGIVIGVIAAVFGVTLWMYKDRLKDAKSMLMVLALLSLIPMGAMLVQERTNLLPKAEEAVTVAAVEAKKIGDNGTLIYVTLSEPAFAYLEYTDLDTGLVKTIVAVGKVEKRFGHSFEIEEIGAGGGEARVVVNGKSTDQVVKLP